MRYFPMLTAAVLVCTWIAPASAQDTPAALAARLGSGSYAEREKAARALEQLGAAAIPALREVAKTSDLETKRRAILVMERIDDRVMQEQLTKASPVRLRFQDELIDDALHQIEQQIGLKTGKAAGKERITLDTGVLPYWQAWERFRAAGKLHESDFARSAAKLKRMSADEVTRLTSMLGRDMPDRRSPPWSPPHLGFVAVPPTERYATDDSHSVRVRVRWHGLDHSLDQKTPHAVFAVEVRAEPRLEILSMPRVEITKIVDDTDHGLKVQSAKLFPEPLRPEDGHFLAAYVGELQYGGLLQLKAIPWQGLPRTLKEVHGRVRVDVTVRPRVMEIPIVAKAVGKEVRGYHGVALKILEVDTTEEGEVLLRLCLDDLGSLAPQSPDQEIVRIRPGVVAVRSAIDVAMERLELLDSLGRKCVQLRGSYERAQKGKGYEAELVFATPESGSAGLTLVMTKGPRTLALEMPFLVRDVVFVDKKEGK